MEIQYANFNTTIFGYYCTQTSVLNFYPCYNSFM
uniref:Uncharacterized protein n=1 Tax=Anguilla anguilla TaxID=7936 RepID=A0A0E9QPE3_ANGAN